MVVLVAVFAPAAVFAQSLSSEEVEMKPYVKPPREELEKKLTPEQLQAAVRKHIDPSQISYFRAGDFVKANVTW